MRKNFIQYLLFAFIVAFTTACSDNGDDIVAPGNGSIMPITDWTATDSSIKASQSEDFQLSYSSSSLYVYEYTGNENVTMSYTFGKGGTLAASCVTIEKSGDASKKLAKLLKGFNKIGTRGNAEVYSNTKSGTAAMLSSAYGSDGRMYTTLSFAPYTPSKVDDADDNLDYVDLGLSVKWAKCNLGASAPEKAGDYYSWSEVKTKSSYWQSNYAYCDDPVYQNVYFYSNPLSNISGERRYDAATATLGAGWRMPTRNEAIELIYNCNWEQTTVNDIRGYKVTGPNGRSIFIPETGLKKQNKEARRSLLLWTSQTMSKTDEYAYTISMNYVKKEPELGEEWKAWGINIRPVKY